jgi:hypothetical protein
MIATVLRRLVGLDRGAPEPAPAAASEPAVDHDAAVEAARAGVELARAALDEQHGKLSAAESAHQAARGAFDDSGSEADADAVLVTRAARDKVSLFVERCTRAVAAAAQALQAAETALAENEIAQIEARCAAVIPAMIAAVDASPIPAALAALHEEISRLAEQEHRDCVRRVQLLKQIGRTGEAEMAQISVQGLKLGASLAERARSRLWSSITAMPEGRTVAFRILGAEHQGY